MSATQEPAGYKLAGDDHVVPYAVASLDVRGKGVQIGPMLDNILKSHDYPQDVSLLLGEMIVLTVLLGSSLKFEGNFILQTQSDGPVSLGVVDYSTPGSVRAYARFDDERLAGAVNQGATSPRQLLGKGVMALTIDQGQDMQRYQGIVELDGVSLEEVADRYFQQSEQIPTKVKLSVAQIMKPRENGDGVETSWRAGGVLCQFFPESAERLPVRDLPGGRADEPVQETEQDDAWAEASALVDTITDDELTDPQIGTERLLYRLFNEHGVRAFESIPVTNLCSCSREKVISLVRSFEDDPQKPYGNNEGFETKCEFCGIVYHISPEEL